jgi:hypothetical protein
VHSIQAFPSRSELRSERAHSVGPLELRVTAPPGRISDIVDAGLGLYDVDWPLGGAPWPINVELCEVPDPTQRPAVGDYLATAVLHVDAGPNRLRATSLSGAVGDGRLDPRGESWLFRLRRAVGEREQAVDIDSFLTLVLATGWRRAGWIPMHGAAVVRGARGLIVCAQGGGGKTTFALALVRRGWQAIGDDKVLLGAVDGSPLMVGVQQILHVDPASTSWLPELAGKTWHSPDISAGVKRRIGLRSVWPGGGVATGTATDVVVLERPVGARGFEIEALDRDRTLDALIRQTAIPNDPKTARATLAMLVRTASRCRGWRLAVGHDAYADASSLDDIASVFT